MSGQETRKLMHTPRHRCGTEASLLRAIKSYPMPIKFLWHYAQRVHNHKGISFSIPFPVGQNITILKWICGYVEILTKTAYF